MASKKPVYLLLLCLAFSACNLPAPTVTITPFYVIRTPTASPTGTPLPVPPETSTPLPSRTPEPSATSTNTPAPTESPTAKPIPTYTNLRGEVIVERANCRYGPGAPYLYKYGLIGGSNLEIIGRIESGAWIEIRAIGGTNPCWVKADLLQIKGNVMDVAPIDPLNVRLPRSPYYGPPTGVSASRSGVEVTVSWNSVDLKSGDDSEQFTYLVEAWVCRQGKIVFAPTGSYQTAVKISDEPGCDTASHGRVFAVEKHGYTRWVNIPWPPAAVSHEW